jgi:hypothetical protein
MKRLLPILLLVFSVGVGAETKASVLLRTTASATGDKMMNDNIKEAVIECKCGCSALTIADGKAILCFECGCEDCRQALQWGYKNGGVEPDLLPRVYYMRSDIVDIKGKGHMKAFKLRQVGRSTRIYCMKCYSVLGVDHPVYESNVFLNFPKYCNNGGDLSTPLAAYIHMTDYSDDGPLPTEDVPLFVSTRFPQERQRLLSIPAVGNAWKKPTEPIKGMTLTSLIESLGSVTVLELVKGETV